MIKIHKFSYFNKKMLKPKREWILFVRNLFSLKLLFKLFKMSNLIQNKRYFQEWQIFLNFKKNLSNRQDKIFLSPCFCASNSLKIKLYK